MRISGVASFYDASSRINNLNRVSHIEATKAQEVKEQNSPAKQEEKSLINYSGIRQTLVSADNAYQKQLLSDPDFAMKRMAGKLMDKLPQIMEDISKLPSDANSNIAEIAKPAEITSSRIVIGENSNVDYAGNTVAALQDISL